jgi:hypothetical protein
MPPAGSNHYPVRWSRRRADSRGSSKSSVRAAPSRVRADLWTETAAIATASLALAGSGLRRTIEAWLDQASLPASGCLLARRSDDEQDSGVAASVRPSARKIAIAADTTTPPEIAHLRTLGLSDAEVLDLTLAASIFSALAIAEPLIAAAG